MKYQTMRGGQVVLQDITKPTTTKWETPLEAVVTVLDLERKMVQSLLELQTKAMAKADFHLFPLVTFVQENFQDNRICYTKPRRGPDLIYYVSSVRSSVH